MEEIKFEGGVLVILKFRGREDKKDLVKEIK